MSAPTKHDPPGGFDRLGLPAEWDGKEPFIGLSGTTAAPESACGKLGCFYEAGVCVYCGELAREKDLGVPVSPWEVE